MSTATRPAITTLANLEAAFAGESMAHIKYRYFARIARAAGDEDTARVFEETADQEVMHAFGHLDLLYPKASLTPAAALQIAIDGETYEYSEMYPGFRATAEREATPPPWPKWTSRLPSPSCTPPSSRQPCVLRKSALLRWPRWRSATPTITKRNWPKLPLEGPPKATFEPSYPLNYPQIEARN